MNPYNGNMPIEVNGEHLTLAFTWDAQARIKAELGNEGQAGALAGDTALLSKLVAIGLAHHHPEWTAEKVLDASPPITPTIEAVDAALIAAYFGPKGMPQDEPENPPQPPATLLKRLWRRLTGQA